MAVLFTVALFLLLCAPSIATDEDGVVRALVGTRGGSGTRCTRKGQHCINGTECVKRKCVCPEGQKGNALIDCVDEDHHLCEASLDPDVIAFGGAKSRMTLPCRHRLSRFVTPNTGIGGRELSFCSFEVFALTQVSNEGQFYQLGVEVNIGLGDLLQQMFTSVDVKKLGIGYKGLYTFNAEGRVSQTPWGNAVHETFNGVSVYCRFDPVDNFAEILVPECDTAVKFRPFNFSEDGSVQRFKPGITIQAPVQGTFDPQFGGYPASLCGLPDDTRAMYKKAKRRPLKDTEAALTFNLLTVAVPQGDEFFYGAYDDECEAASQTLSVCLDRRLAVQFCNELILADPTNLRCLVKKAINPMGTFDKCLKFMCFQTNSTYHRFKDEINQCADFE